MIQFAEGFEPAETRPGAQFHERRAVATTSERLGAQAVNHPALMHAEAVAETRPDGTKSFGRKAARFLSMSGAIVVVSLLSAALFGALVPDDPLSPTNFLPRLAAWMGGAAVGLAAGIAALFRAGSHR